MAIGQTDYPFASAIPTHPSVLILTHCLERGSQSKILVQIVPDPLHNIDFVINRFAIAHFLEKILNLQFSRGETMRATESANEQI